MSYHSSGSVGSVYHIPRNHTSLTVFIHFYAAIFSLINGYCFEIASEDSIGETLINIIA